MLVHIQVSVDAYRLRIGDGILRPWTCLQQDADTSFIDMPHYILELRAPERRDYHKW